MRAESSTINEPYLYSLFNNFETTTMPMGTSGVSCHIIAAEYNIRMYIKLLTYEGKLRLIIFFIEWLNPILLSNLVIKKWSIAFKNRQKNKRQTNIINWLICLSPLVIYTCFGIRVLLGVPVCVLSTQRLPLYFSLKGYLLLSFLYLNCRLFLSLCPVFL